MGFKFTFHDLRRSFIANAARVHHIRDVQLAAGHKELNTTMIYLRDDRELDNETWKPEE